MILLDTTFRGVRACFKAEAGCDALGVAVHSAGKLGIRPAAMPHLGAVIPKLSFGAGAHSRLSDDIIEGGPMHYRKGAARVAAGTGLRVKPDREKPRKYNGLYRRPGGFPYDRHPGRQEWTPVIPNDCRADPNDNRSAPVPCQAWQLGG